MFDKSVYIVQPCSIYYVWALVSRSKLSKPFFSKSHYVFLLTLRTCTIFICGEYWTRSLSKLLLCLVWFVNFCLKYEFKTHPWSIFLGISQLRGYFLNPCTFAAACSLSRSSKRNLFLAVVLTPFSFMISYLVCPWNLKPLECYPVV